MLKASDIVFYGFIPFLRFCLLQELGGEEAAGFQKLTQEVYRLLIDILKLPIRFKISKAIVKRKGG